mmetsp:Transcript_44963/g.105493  ORF Transcript_44963/g.105493 Transcript_44963/m.105493 type:complete len:163 (-) Transcript_44963:248-736(-)
MEGSSAAMNSPVHAAEEVEMPAQLAIGGSMGIIELVEEYALFAVIVGALLFFLYRKTREGVESAIFAKRSRESEESMRRTRELQQAKYELETAERREALAKIADERRKQKLEDMEAASQGRSSKKPETKKPKDTRDYWDSKGGFNSGGGRFSSFKPPTRRRG